MDVQANVAILLEAHLFLMLGNRNLELSLEDPFPERRFALRLLAVVKLFSLDTG